MFDRVFAGALSPTNYAKTREDGDLTTQINPSEFEQLHDRTSKPLCELRYLASFCRFVRIVPSCQFSSEFTQLSLLLSVELDELLGILIAFAGETADVPSITEDATAGVREDFLQNIRGKDLSPSDSLMLLRYTSCTGRG